MEDYPNLTACGATIRAKCKGCTNLDRHERAIGNTLENSGRQITLLNKAADALTGKTLEAIPEEQSDLIEETRKDYLKETLKFTLRSIISQVHQANNLQAHCEGALSSPMPSGNRCQSKSIS